MVMFMLFFSDFLYKSICCGYSFELHRQVDAIQMCTHNICVYKQVYKTYSSCNLKTTELLDRALIGVCAVIRSNTIPSHNYVKYLFQSNRSRENILNQNILIFFIISQRKYML